MGIEIRGIVVDGELRLRVPFADGTDLTVSVEPASEHRTVQNMTNEEFRVWLDEIWGSCPDLEEPDDLPPEPLDWSWDD